MPQEPTTPNRSSTSSEPNTPNNQDITRKSPPDIYLTRQQKKRKVEFQPHEDMTVTPKLLNQAAPNQGQASNNPQLFFSAPFNPYTQIDASQQMPVNLEEDGDENTLQEVTQDILSNQSEVIRSTPPAIKRFRF